MSKKTISDILGDIPLRTHTEALEDIKLWWKAGRAVFLWGPPGIGKSSLCRAAAASVGIENICEVDTPQLQPYDYAMAVPHHETQTVRLYKSGFLPDRGPAVLIFEELNRAKHYQQIPALQIILDKRIGPLRLPMDCYCIASGNRELDDPGVVPLGAALLNRFAHIEIRVDPEAWVRNFAAQHGVHQSVVAFNLAYPQYHLEKVPESQRPFATPRSWQFLSDAINHLPEPERENSKRLVDLAYQVVGPVAASAYSSFLTMYTAINPTRVLRDGILPDLKEMERSQLYGATVSVALRAQSMGQEIVHLAKNFYRFFDALPGDFRTSFLFFFVQYGTGNQGEKYLLFRRIKESLSAEQRAVLEKAISVE